MLREVRNIEQIIDTIKHGLRFSENKIKFRGLVRDTILKFIEGKFNIHEREELYNSLTLNDSSEVLELTVYSICFTTNTHEETPKAVLRLFGDFGLEIEDEWLTSIGFKEVYYFNVEEKDACEIEQSMESALSKCDLLADKICAVFECLSCLEQGQHMEEAEWRIASPTDERRIAIPIEQICCIYVTSEEDKRKVDEYFLNEQVQTCKKPEIVVEIQNFLDVRGLFS